MAWIAFTVYHLFWIYYLFYIYIDYFVYIIYFVHIIYNLYKIFFRLTKDETIAPVNLINIFIFLLATANSPVSPHIQQNGFNNGTTNPAPVSASAQVSGTQPATTLPQNYTGAGGTWTGSNTLTYTQTMQPPDNRNHHGSYCKLDLTP